jgi:hypothetical protein
LDAKLCGPRDQEVALLLTVPLLVKLQHLVDVLVPPPNSLWFFAE